MGRFSSTRTVELNKTTIVGEDGGMVGTATNQGDYGYGWDVWYAELWLDLGPLVPHLRQFGLMLKHREDAEKFCQLWCEQ